MGAFKAYDIRGIYNKDFDKDTVYRIGYFLPRLLPADHVIVGRDIRKSSDEIFEALSRGITDAGVDVWNIGLATTPLVYFATAYLKADASVQITASHNPKEYNGLKISRTGALPVGENSGLRDLEAMVTSDEKPVKAAKPGKVIEKNLYPDYVAFQKGFLPDISDLNISIDCSSGMSALFVKELFGEKPHYINVEFDGDFKAHEPNPLEEKNCEQLKAAVVKNKSDVGVIYDGDADRMVIVDDKGRFVQPDYITAVIGYYYKNIKGITGNSLVDIRTSRSSTEYLEKLGFPVTIWKVGHAYAKMKIREIDGVFGGELAGHYYFRDFFNCDSGILASLLVLTVVADLKKKGKTLSGLLDEIVRYANSGETNFRLNNKDGAMEALKAAYASNAEKVLDFDGYRIEYPTWWFNVRKSNTEPYLRLVVEAESKDELEKHFTELKKIIEQFD